MALTHHCHSGFKSKSKQREQFASGEPANKLEHSHTVQAESREEPVAPCAAGQHASRVVGKGRRAQRGHSPSR